MKTLKIINIITTFLLAALVTAVSQQADSAPNQPKSGDTQNDTVKSEAATAQPQAVPEEKSANSGLSAVKSKAQADGTLRLNFRGVPVDMVLDYLSDAAGFIIIKETDVKGKVDVWSNQPLTRDEAVDLLNTILNKNDYAAIRNGRTLTIVSKD